MSGPVGIYMLHNPHTEEVYVGSGDLEDRKRKHFRSLENGRVGKTNAKGQLLKNHNRNLQAAYNRDQNFQFHGVLLETREDAFDCEQAIIDKFKDNKKFLNISDDARAGAHGMSEETREKISIAKRRFYQEHPEAIEEMRQRNLGNIASEETRLKQSLAQKQSYENNPERREANSLALSNRVITDETRAKLSAINKGKNVSDETRQKLRDANLGKTVSQETKELLSEMRKGIPKSEEHKAKIADKTKDQWNNESYRQRMQEANGIKVKVGDQICDTIKQAATVAGITYHQMRSKLSKGGDDKISYV